MPDPPRFIDVSHTITDGLLTYPGLPAPSISDHLSRAAAAAHYAPGTSFQIGKIAMVANTGTYLDAPFHRFEDGDDLSALPLDALADLPTVVVDVPDGAARAIGVETLEGIDVGGCAVLLRTGWSDRWGRPAYFEGYPYLTAPAARWLADQGARLVGIDAPNVDDTGDGQRPAHTVLLGAGIPIVEHLTNLSALPAGGARFFAVPVKVQGMGSFPVRAFAIGPSVSRPARRAAS